ncbi:mannitol/sorbitol ABC transporter permease [Neoasaia chiangmaiensis NBRC 101099]|uniref:ABC transporter n=1 Tax=Neoasaia chiangmaiensis TaxID=320497 RepID=A0A1U9KS73_9PROT|nr:sn-glycerol-3-phosphate ABC transporter ATP-binding protein UgpC [Neoasaia chiangmaiensis]AQS88691.1 ABC transporter [Neoasaia chiangmaiensis]GBR41017.1 mannitol/sorbitol ABC transporter permease [Neoasaia chiangmaiensis NBRC 101099]GEN13645.1 sugar ABC transporter ATP-binding protein [Neoasaia chiangmaiensis]
MATVELKDIRKTYLTEEIIKGVSLSIEDKEFVVFVGPSGCGKSTLLRMIAGLEDISSGDLLIDGRRVNEVEPAKRGLAMVFQSYALYPHMNVYQNMEFGLKLAKMPEAERRQKITDVARVLQLEPYLKHKPGQLSGGQRQRVAIGRAIVRNPKVFLFDEPLSNLDAALRGQMRVELATLHRRLNATTIYVTHDQIEAMTMADKIVVLQKGVVEQVGSPLELYHHPRNLFVARFIGSPPMNFLPATVTNADESGVQVQLATGQSLHVPVMAASNMAGGAVTLGIRPEHILLDQAEGQGTIELVERLGALTQLHVRLPDDQLLVIQTDGAHGGALDAPIGFAFPPEHCHIFDADGLALDKHQRHRLAA